MNVILLLILSCYISAVYGSDFYRTLLYGESFKGFLNIEELKDDEYVVSFETIDSPSDDVRWGVHISSAPYDMAVMTDNCKRVKKSPHLMREKNLNDSSIVKRDILMGNTIVVGTRDEVLACATVILPGQALYSGTFHADPIEGHVHIIPMPDQVRILSDLRYMTKYDEEYDPGKYIITWGLVSSCESYNFTDADSDGTELGVDSRTTISYYVANYSLEGLALFQDDKPFACAKLLPVEPRVVMAVNHGFSQQNYYEPVRVVTENPPKKLRIRDDCLDLATETVHDIFDNYYPSINLFGRENIILKSLDDGLCTVLRPQFPKPAATAYFMHPINGRLTIVDMDDNVHLTGELRHVFEETPARASIQISNKTAGPIGCDPDYTCDDCVTVMDAAIVVGKNDNTVSLSGKFDWFEIKGMKSVIVDMQWTKICANLTYLEHGALSAHVLFKRVSPASTATVASIVALEYPANNYTEVLVNKRQPFSHSEAHQRPVDSSITSGPPCGEQNLGPVKKVFWTPRLTSILSSDANDTSVFIWFNMITGVHSVLGTSVLLSHDKQVYCGDFEPLTEKRKAVARFNGTVQGFIRLTQHSSSNWASGLPTEADYMLETSGNSRRQENMKEEFDWEIVSGDGTCSGAVIYNPFKVNQTECSPTAKFLCPLGNATAKSSSLIAGMRNHMVVYDLPLTGPFSVIGHKVRIKSRRTQKVECADVVEHSEATFRWTVPSNKSLSTIQAEFAKKVDIQNFQIQVDYTRELYKSRCSIFRITVSAEESKVAHILDLFDVEARKFKNDSRIICGDEDSINTSTITTQSSAVLSGYLMIFTILCILWCSI